METVDGYPRQVWRNQRGEDVIESYTIPRMAHGTPLAAGDSHDKCGTPGAFLLDVGISSSYHIAKFWGLTGRLRRFVDTGKPAQTRPAPPNGQRQGSPTPPPPPRGPAPTGTRAIDIHAVITKALKSAGLWKSP
jgi:hypothetical protein